MYGKNEHVEIDSLINKANNGWRKKVTSTSEQTGKEQSISRDTQPKRVNNQVKSDNTRIT